MRTWKYVGTFLLLLTHGDTDDEAKVSEKNVRMRSRKLFSFPLFLGFFAFLYSPFRFQDCVRGKKPGEFARRSSRSFDCFLCNFTIDT